MTHASLGARRRRLVLERPMDESDGFGGRLRRYVAGPVLWGAVEPLGASGGSGRYWVRLRYRPGIVPAMRLADGARRFAIHSADDPDGRRRALVCEVEEMIEEPSA